MLIGNYVNYEINQWFLGRVKYDGGVSGLSKVVSVGKVGKKIGGWVLQNLKIFIFEKNPIKYVKKKEFNIQISSLFQLKNITKSIKDH